MKALDLKENLRKYTRIEECPIRKVLSHITSKWSLLVVCVLSENEKTRFNEIQRAIPDISSKVLSDTMKSLERDNIVSREVHAEIPPRVEYSLTDLGRSILPRLEPLLSWAIDNFENFNKKQ